MTTPPRITPLRVVPEPRATLELNEGELAYLTFLVGNTPISDTDPNSHTVFEKLQQLTAIEHSPGGCFSDEAA